ncbi:MAG: GIY-YIG nuclease family protein [Cellvibrionaceae bacterium]|nr:GIY-YIG nuclease family protein [Cellvibrionaceae bacterium]
MSPTWYVYMILTDKKCLYTGIATDVMRRWREHQQVADGVANARGAKYFRSQKPLQVVYVEAFADRPQALRRERLIKAMSAAQKRRLCTSQSGERANPAVFD